MDSKFYVSFDAARLLKEKGYNVHCTHLYKSRNELRTTSLVYDMDLMSNEELHTNHYAAPSKAEVIDWLESKGMCIVVIRRTIDNEVGWRYVIYNQTEIISGFSTRLEAEEAAIIKALELLNRKEE